MHEKPKADPAIANESEVVTAFTPPQGWRRSEQQTMSKFAFEMSNTTNWYRNDGQGNGYFAPGWDKERIARRTGIFRWIGLALAAIIIGIGATAYTAQFSEQRHYDRLKSAGVQSVGVIGPIAVEHSSRRAREGSRQYTTTTSAPLTFKHHGAAIEGWVEHKQTRTRDFFSTSQVASSTQYPEPFWHEGDTVGLYYDPERPEDFVLHHDYKEADAGAMPRGALLVLIFAGVFLIIPILFIVVGVRNVRRSKEL